ncbi:hypothetical protein [Streptomyces spinosirectus]
MSDDQNHPAREPVEPVLPTGKRPVRRGRIAAVAASALLAVAVVAGVGYTVVTVNGADRDAGAAVWKFPKDPAEKAGTVSPKGLAGMLVPYEADGWSRGPDIAEYGADAQLGGREATALRKQSLSGLPRTQRKALEREIDKQRITGLAMRSYVGHDATSPVGADEAATVGIELAQMDNKAAVRNISESQNAVLDAVGVFRDGPKIKGHKHAGCFLPPTDKDEKLDWMYCSAYEGNVLVTLTASSAKPLQKAGIAELLKQQLDRITEPGESV